MHPLIPFHVVAASLALASGFAALAFRKGSPLHARAGTVFFISLLAMAGSGAIVALAMPERGTAAVGILSCYLVATSWATARRRSGEAAAFELIAMVVAIGCAAAFLTIGLIGLSRPDGRLDELPAAFHFPFAFIAALAAALDLNFILRARLTGQQRIARHVWRMCTALLMAAFSFFLGQADKLPDIVRQMSLNFIPPVVVVVVMLFWIVRLRFAKAFPRGRRHLRENAPALAPEHA